jgi:hypothetical protein
MYSHFLTLQIVDSSNNLIENPELLEEIKRSLTRKAILQKISFDEQQTDLTIDFFVIWERAHWLRPYNHVVSDLATKSHMKTDLMIHDHTNLTIDQIESTMKTQDSDRYGTDWRIVWYLTKPMFDPTKYF